MPAPASGWYAPLVDGLVKALSGAFIFLLGWATKASEDEKEALRAEIKRLQRDAEIRRRQSDAAERQRVRTRFEDKG